MVVNSQKHVTYLEIQKRSSNVNNATRRTDFAVQRANVIIKTYLLLLQSGHISANRSQTSKFGIFSDHPLDKLAQGQQKSVPVFGVAFQSISVKRKEKEKRK